MAGYDLTNKKFGKLTAVKVAKRDSSGHNHWQCECECGNTVIVRATELLNGKKTMCNSCKKSALGYSIQTKQTSSSNNTASQSKAWLEDNGITYKDIDDFDNIVDVHTQFNPVTGEHISILSAPIVYKIVHAINSDLTYAESTYIGNGQFDDSLAKQIDEFFHIRNQLDDLMNIPWEVGDAIYTAPVYHLLTKMDKNDTTNYDALYTCLENLADKSSQQGNYYLAFPRICCGKDKLDWDIVLQMILHIFGEDYNILLF